MDKTGTILLSRPAICRMLGELAGERFIYGVKSGNGTELRSRPLLMYLVPGVALCTAIRT